MLVLGLSGGLDLMHQRRRHLFQPGICHDAAAVLVEDGKVIAAIEEERINRVKHTSKGAVNAIAWCLKERDIALADLDRLVYYGSEEGCNAWTRNLFYSSRDAEPVVTFRQLIHEMLNESLDADLEDSKLGFVHHHYAHALSCITHSGFNECLVFTVDGAGDGLSGTVSVWCDGQYELIMTYPEASSLGNLYDRVIQMIGFSFTEEYKVMGLAPYGNPLRFQKEFNQLYSLLPNGGYEIHWAKIETLYSLMPVRKKGQPILQEHIDLAAALQSSVEHVVFHILSYFRVLSGMRSLCLAGGVAHNSTLNGKILSSGLYEHLFVHPASGDAGCAIGAAVSPFYQQQNTVRRPPTRAIEHVFWGTDIGSDTDIGEALERWKPIISYTHEADIAGHCAKRLIDGEVIGWVQGRSEFGPRALGHRSILADPRPRSNKRDINAIVKKREGFRPFAPAVNVESVSDIFCVPESSTNAAFMSFTLQVKPDYRNKLGAITHVDNTARVQTVAKETDPLFWSLIDAFGRGTGIPVVLNTSFNNNAEPIVDSIDDAVVCFLTTGLHRLAVGEYVVTQELEGLGMMKVLCPSLCAYSSLINKTEQRQDQRVTSYSIISTVDDSSVEVSELVYRLLSEADGIQKLESLLGEGLEGQDEVAAEFMALWEQRLINMLPQ